MRPAPFIAAAALCLLALSADAADKRIPANKNPVTHLPPFPLRVDRGGGDAVGSGLYMNGLPNHQVFPPCLDGRAKNYGKLRKRLNGFPLNPPGCIFWCDDPLAINAGEHLKKQEYFDCLYTCTDPAAINHNIGPHPHPVQCLYTCTDPAAFNYNHGPYSSPVTCVYPPPPLPPNP